MVGLDALDGLIVGERLGSEETNVVGGGSSSLHFLHFFFLLFPLIPLVHLSDFLVFFPDLPPRWHFDDFPFLDFFCFLA